MICLGKYHNSLMDILKLVEQQYQYKLIILTVFSMLIGYIFIIVMLSLIIVIYAILPIKIGMAE
ncbi:unnamed protein product [Paramecium pentaurelia]|uniref:Uncharacterized protein n=1 Tax=Paramecium pentaurelia TaxID=43138 RepID=A0A8S1TWU0_9CILI|nr:unnamed protein product [Paramecium pentaurelia]